MWLYVLLAVAVVVMAFAYLSGLFYRPVAQIGKPPLDGALRIAFKAGRGPYKNVKPFFDEVLKIYPNAQAIGIYYDDPTTVLPTNLRWLVGMVTEVNGKQVIPLNVEGELKSKQYHFANIPAVQQAVVSKFPCYGILSMFLAPMRVYPAINTYGKQTGVYGNPAIEYYNVTAGFIDFAMPTTDSDAFMVKEISEMI